MDLNGNLDRVMFQMMMSSVESALPVLPIVPIDL